MKPLTFLKKMIKPCYRIFLLFVKILVTKVRKERKSILFFTVHKTASSFVNIIYKKLCNLTFTIYYAPRGGDIICSEREPFKNIGSISSKNRCFAPLRYFTDIPRIEDYIIFLQLRDPRDVLVSLFFSSVYSHPRRPGAFNPTDEERQRWRNEGIGKFVLDRADYFLSIYKMYCDNLLGKSNVTFIKYEDMVADLRSWLATVISPFNIADKDKVVEALFKKYGSIYSVERRENVHEHIRKVTPGDYKCKLKAETISRLNSLFKDVLAQLDYTY